MKFAINGNESDIRTITVKAWNDQSFWGPDVFDDLETNFPRTHAKLPGSDILICTEEEYQEVVDYWTEEIQHENDYADMDAPELFIFAD
jgi:hypothetical protein